MRLFEKIVNKIALSLYMRGRAIYIANRYGDFRARYSIEESFRFNGEDVLLYGEGSIVLGKESYIGEHSTIYAHPGYRVEVGKRCQISHNVRIYTQSLQADVDLSSDIREEKLGNVIVEDFVWIGANVMINPGIRIGRNSIVGANSVVTKDIDPDSIYGGVPSKLIRRKRYRDA